MTFQLTPLRGTRCPQAKLTDDQVAEIRELHRRKEREVAELHKRYSAKALADAYGVHVRTVEKVLSYETWKHVKD